MNKFTQPSRVSKQRLGNIPRLIEVRYGSTERLANLVKITWL